MPLPDKRPTLDYGQPDTENAPHVSPVPALPPPKTVDWRGRIQLLAMSLTALILFAVLVARLISEYFDASPR